MEGKIKKEGGAKAPLQATVKIAPGPARSGHVFTEQHWVHSELSGKNCSMIICAHINVWLCEKYGQGMILSCINVKFPLTNDLRS